MADETVVKEENKPIIRYLSVRREGGSRVVALTHFLPPKADVVKIELLDAPDAKTCVLKLTATAYR